ncbi:hypothetical protein [Ulvibacterium sp.]|uniref:hypothetical protein n=1 Tax=Ulvibacterium sp. TaxID=2665914 RepID=UPI002631B52F|nr:hypothetical protein [Ulvibacterium sp.]
MQQLQEQQSGQEQELPQLVHSKYEFVLFSFSKKLSQTKCIISAKKSFPLITDHYSHVAHWDIFHPPQA